MIITFSHFDLHSQKMNLDAGPYGLIDFRLEDALEVYRTVWNDFYDVWEQDYCINLIKDCERPVDDSKPDQTRKVNHANEAYGPLEFDFEPQDDGDLEYFTVEEFNTFEETERYLTLSCSNKCTERAKSGYPQYEFCTPASRNHIKEDLSTANLSLPFIPYADDTNFNVEEYLEGFDKFSWQTDFPDPDWETIELQAATHLVYERDYTLDEIDSLKILRMSRINHSSGLLWDTAQRDLLKPTFSEAPSISENFVYNGKDIRLHLSRVVHQFCPKLSCLSVFCGSHDFVGAENEDIETPEPELTSEELKKLSLYECGISCFRAFSDAKIIEDRTMRDAERPLAAADHTFNLLHATTRDHVAKNRVLASKKAYTVKEAADVIKPAWFAGKGATVAIDLKEAEGLWNAFVILGINAFAGCQEESATPNYVSGVTLGKSTKVKCRNVPVQRGKFPSIQIMHGSYGLGAFTPRALQPGVVLGEYVGEILRADNPNHPSFDIIHKHVGLNYMFKVHSEITLDSAKLGNETRYLNDSKDEPEKNNCEARVVLIDGDHRIVLVTTQSVAKGQELLLGYGETYWDPQGTDTGSHDAPLSLENPPDDSVVL
ncbi:hypothetical protein H0H87_007013 [Tephrocybe sp. NHM501043]|nr:hypothetical protein H0H87_007013 [Tephrocybe sp. NHM501043]